MGCRDGVYPTWTLGARGVARGGAWRRWPRPRCLGRLVPAGPHRGETALAGGRGQVAQFCSKNRPMADTPKYMQARDPNLSRSGVGHVIFAALHVLALLFAWVLLFVTVPLHILYAVMTRPKPGEPTPYTHYRCPDCREYVLNGAKVCKHCGRALAP